MGFRRGPSVITDGLVFAVDTAAERSYSNLLYNDLSPTKTTFVATSGCDEVTDFGGGLKCDNNTTDFIVSNDKAATNYVTVEVFYKLWGSSYTSDGIVFNKENTWEVKDGGGDLQWALYASNQGWFWWDTAYNVSVGETLCVSLSYDGSAVKAYVNGTLWQTYNYPAGGVLANQSTAYPKFNSRHATQGTYENGGQHTLYNYRIYNRALSDSEVAHNFNVLKGRFGL